MPEPTGHTVIILGAGASADYGLPIGSGLRTWILTNAREWLFEQLGRRHQSTATTPNLLGEGEQDWESDLLRGQIDSFVKQFGHAGPATIDDFLGRNPGLSDFGRLAIVNCLLHAQDEALSADDYGAGCYGLLCKSIADAGVDAAIGRLRIINFNYDRTFPMMVATMLKSLQYVADADTFVHELDGATVHPYGSIGLRYRYDIQRHTFRRIHSVTGTQTDKHSPNDYLVARNGIRIIERKKDTAVDEGFKKARDWLSDARAVYFLGFGFDKTNLERLGFDGTQKPCQNAECMIHATTFKLRPERRNDVSVLLSKSMLSQTNVRLGETDEKCFDFLDRLGGIKL